MMFLCSPHNPVGRCWTTEELARISKICIENEVILISDEIHNDLILPGNCHKPAALCSDDIVKNLVTCIAPSKTFNMAGLATSTVIIQDEVLREKYKSILESVHITNGNLFGMIASQAGYTNGDQWLEELLTYLQGNFNLLSARLEKEFETLKMIPAEATYLAWIDFRKTGLSDDEIKENLINKAGIGLSHGPIFGTGGSGFQRMNLAAPSKTIDHAVDCLKSVFR
jgi:cystathionine beta-lyase